MPLWVYLPSAQTIASSHTLTFQPFNSPHNGLYPLQVDIHWAVLFTISNETAIQGWDYLCAFSFLSGIGLLAWLLTSNQRVALVAILIMFSFLHTDILLSSESAAELQWLWEQRDSLSARGMGFLCPARFYVCGYEKRGHTSCLLSAAV